MLERVFNTTDNTTSNDLKALVASIGATGLNGARYLRAFKQINARHALLADVVEFHRNHPTLDLHVSRQLSMHRQIIAEHMNLLDINNTIIHTPVWLSNWNKYLSEYSNKAFLAEMKVPKKPKAFQDLATVELIKMQNNSRASYCKQRIQNELGHADANGWFIVFDTLTLADDKIQDFYHSHNAIGNYCRNIGRAAARADGTYDRDGSTSHCHKYFIAPEYGTKNGRLHFHVIHLFKTLPSNSLDPNFGRASNKRNRRIIESLRGFWSYGFSAPISVRYSGDAFSRLGWLMPIDETGKIIELKPLEAVGHYVAKYVNKTIEQTELQQIKKGKCKWKSTLTMAMGTIPKHLFRIRMTRGFGMQSPPMWHLTTEVLIELTKLHWSVTKISRVLKVNAQKEILLRLVELNVKDTPALMPPAINLLKSLRDSMKQTQDFNMQSYTLTLTPKLKNTGISNGTKAFLETFNLFTEKNGLRSSKCLGTK